ncbi:MAG: radical SAM protein [Candidatus Woesearchaeota archaeon]
MAQIEPTTRCNLNCKICCGRFLEQGDMDFEDFKIMISKLPHLRCVLLQGEGEPLLNPDFFKMVAFLKQKNVYVHTITNGTLLQKEAIKSIISSGINKLAFSIDSYCQDDFIVTKPTVKLDVVITNLRQLIRERDRLNPNLKVGFDSIITNPSCEFTRRFIDFASSIGIDFIERKVFV